MKISVCIPTYNQGEYIEQTVRSAYSQSILPFEVIVTDDRSTDNTAEILKQLAREFETLKVITHPENMGMVGNTNFCLRQASGDFIVKLDSDDYLLPDYIKLLSELLERYPDAGYAHASVQEIDGFGQKQKIRTLRRETGFKNSDTALKECINGYKVAANIIMFRRIVLEKVNFITKNVLFGEDYYLSASIAAAGYGNVYDSKILACYRVWSDVNNVRKKRKINEINGLTGIFEMVIEPAFKEKGWDLTPVYAAKAKFAKNQADCLTWDIFSKDELQLLEKAILNLSSDKTVSLYVKIYKSKLAIVLKSYYSSKKWLSAFLKQLLKGK